MQSQITTCSLVGCQAKVFSRTWCKIHYMRWYKHGDPFLTLTPNRVIRATTDAERFWPKVNRTDTCWLWEGTITRDGYGQFRLGSTKDGTRRLVKAHRFAFQLTSPIPPGLVLDHLCGIRRCVRPSHLEPVTVTENTRRAQALRVY